MGSVVVGVCIGLLVIAAAFVVLTAGGEPAALLAAFRALPWPTEVAWAVIVIAPLALVVAAIQLWSMLAKQRQATQALELRLDGVRDGVKSLVKTQVDAEAALHQLARTDPEHAIGAMAERLAAAEHRAQIQHGRNEVADLESRVESIRSRQQALKERLAPVLERRRSIEQLFTELDQRQRDLDRALDEIASGEDVAAIDIGLNKMLEFIRRSHARCDDIERAAKAMAGLQEDFGALRARLAPFAAAEDGVAARLKGLHETRDRLAMDIDSLFETPQGALAERVQKFTEEKKSLDRRLSEMNGEFVKLATLRKDLAGLFAGFDRALDALAVEARGEGAAAVDARSEELAAFINGTQTDIHDLERRLATFRQLKAKLTNLQMQLAPLETENGGIVSLIGEVKDIRDRLALKIRRLEESDDGSLADRIKKFSETRDELEERAATLNEQVRKLAAIRADIAGLFDKLSTVVAASAN